MYALKKQIINLNGESGEILNHIELTKDEGKISKSKLKALKSEDYQVMGLEDESKTHFKHPTPKLHNEIASLSILADHSFDIIESKLTSVSSKGKGKMEAGSLTTILCQSLISEDTETLDWIFK